MSEPVINDPPSPSSSGIRYECNVLTNPNFIIDWPLLKEDYYSASNASKCLWFEQIDQNLREKVKQAWIVDKQRHAANIPFFLWFLTFTSQKGLNDVYTLPGINVQTNLAKVWHLPDGISIVSILLLRTNP